MTTLLNEVLNYHVPDTWDKKSYDGVQAVLLSTIANHEEYKNVIFPGHFPDDLKNRVISVHRVQNPYMYGRYRLRIEQLQCKGLAVHEERWYHPILQSNKADVVAYNCDYRRYTAENPSQKDGKRAKFYREPQIAIQGFRHYSTSAMSLVVLKVISTDGNGFILPTTCTKDWDTEYYPEYIVDLN